MKQIARERFETAWLSNPEIFSVHELPDCSDHAFYATMAEADADASSLVKLLDGAWKAHFAMNPSEAPDTLLTSAALDETLREIQVPCEFQMEAPEWDPPHYVNTQYPWDGHEALQAPQVSEVYNPTVTCIRHFALSLPQVQQRTVLHLAGVEAAVLVYVNGHEVGYAEDSFTPHRFDLTPYVHVGENRLGQLDGGSGLLAVQRHPPQRIPALLPRNASLRPARPHTADGQLHPRDAGNAPAGDGCVAGQGETDADGQGRQDALDGGEAADGAGKLRQRGDSRREAVERGRAESLHADRRADECAGASD